MKFVVVTAFLLALLIVEVVIGVAVYRHASEIAYNGRMNDYERSASRLALSMDEAIEAGKTQTPDLTGTLKSDNTFLLSDSDVSYKCDPAIAENLAKGVCIYRLREICNRNQTADDRINSDDTVYVIYSEKQEDESYLLSFRSFADLTSEISFEGFGAITIFSGSGRSEYIDGTADENSGIGEDLPDELKEYRMDPDNVTANGDQRITVGSGVYTLWTQTLQSAPAYTVGGYADFSGGQKELNSLRSQGILSIVGITALTTVIVYLCAYVFGNRREKSAYFFTVNPAGEIIYRNKRFEKDFPHVREIAERLNRFDEDRIYTLSLAQEEEENKLLSCFVRKHFNGTIDVFGRELTVPYGNDVEIERKDNMSAMFRSLSDEHPKVLLGMIYFNNIAEIKDVFGREFSESVRNLLLDRVRKQFDQMFVFDYYTLGVLQPDGSRLEIMMRNMEQIVSELNRVVKAGENNVLVNVKCGFALSDPSVKELSYDDVMAAANAALKRACEPQADILNSVDYYVFMESQRKLYSRYLFKIDIPQMLKNGDFYLEYQPQYSLSEDRIVGFEALFRVNRRVQINVSTLDIINYAEQSGNMVLLGNFILSTGMKFAKSIEGKGVSVSLNVSPVQLMQTGFVDNFLNIYRSYDLQPGSISVEITESYLVSDINATLKKLNVLRSSGIEIHLDDFGTGYSSFNYLSVLPISTIKIDQSFVRDISDNRVNRLITKTIVEICKNLKLESICEGVEKPDQLELVRELGCDIIQGYVISRSVNEETARDMIEHYRYQPPAAEPSEDEPSDETKS